MFRLNQFKEPMKDNAKTLTTEPEFGRFRSFFWPIHNYELVKLIPMFGLFFLISFVYNLLRCMKISLIVTAEGSGADAIPFLKIGAVLPGALLFTWIFTKVASNYSREKIFYIMLSLFLGFFTFFLLVIYPNKEHFELIGLSNTLSHYIPEGYSGLLAMIRHWSLSLFYVVSELWSTVVLSMLFWGFANEVTKVNEAKRFYAIFALGANGSGIFSGYVAHEWLHVKEYNPLIPYGTDAWSQTFFLQLSAVLVFGLVIMAIFRYLNTRVIDLCEDDEHPEDSVAAKKSKKPKVKLTLTECFAYLFKSRYLAYIVIMVVAYNVVYNLADVLWTDQVDQTYTNTNDLNAYMNKITSVTGVFAVIFAFIISGNVIRRYGWTVAAVITPIIWMLGSAGFFSGLFLNGTELLDSAFVFLGNPGNIALLFGSAQICLGRACKYTVFDETKEIAFIPLSKENQRKGKAVVDGLASRFGKSGGSVIYLILLGMTGSLAASTPYVAAIIVVSIFLWIASVISLGKMVKSSIDMESDDPILEEPKALNTEKPVSLVGSDELTLTSEPAKV